MTPIDLLNRAEQLAPQPTDRDAPAADWVRHYAAQALAALAGFRNIVSTTVASRSDEAGRELAYLSVIGHTSISAAVALDAPRELTPRLLWDLTPEAGALNGEWEDWLIATLDRLGVNPADIHNHYEAGDFRSPSRKAEVAG